MCPHISLICVKTVYNVEYGTLTESIKVAQLLVASLLGEFSDALLKIVP